MTRRSLVFTVLVLVLDAAAMAGGLLRPARTALAAEPLLTNADFAAWKDGRPVGWRASEGAHTGYQGPKTETNRFEPIEGGGIASITTPTARRWMLLSQRFEAKPGELFRLDFEVRAAGLVQAKNQFPNRWIGAFFKDAQGARLAFPLTEIHSETWQRGFLHIQAPKGTAYGEAGFFCSLTGRFEVRRMTLARIDPKASFDVLVEDMDRYYPFFAQHEIDWRKLVAAHREQAEAATTPTAFVDAITPMLAALADGHIWIDAPRRRREVPHKASVKLNFELPQVLQRLASHQQVLRNVLAGRTKDGYGYLAIGSMEGSRPQLGQLDGAWRQLFDAPAIVLDLRVNSGGQEVWGQHLLGCLTDKPLLYGTSKLRAGPGHEDFHAGSMRYVNPRPVRYTGPVIALVGPGCVSSGEGMAMMARALPNVTLVGLPTRGSSGAPAPVALPNGVRVWYSRWISLLPDGTGFERSGIPPDIRVEHTPGGDPTFDRALDLIKERLAATGGK